MDWKIGVSLAVLFVNAVSDIKRKRICFTFTLVYLVTGMCFWVYRFCCGEENSWMIWLGALVPGVFLCLLSWMSHGNIGMGDGIILLALGVWHGFEFTAEALIIALFAVSVYAGYLILVQRAGRKRQIPFVPFVLLGAIGGVFS